MAIITVSGILVIYLYIFRIFREEKINVHNNPFHVFSSSESSEPSDTITPVNTVEMCIIRKLYIKPFDRPERRTGLQWERLICVCSSSPTDTFRTSQLIIWRHVWLTMYYKFMQLHQFITQNIKYKVNIIVDKYSYRLHKQYGLFSRF